MSSVSLDGTRVAVSGRSPLAPPLADGLRAAGASVGDMGAPGPLHGVVHVGVEPDELQVTALAELDEASWVAAGEAPVWRTVEALQAAFRLFEGRGGRIVVVVPTVSMSGAAGLVPGAAAAEGQRSLVKSAARQWGRHGITVNCVAVAPELLGAPAAAAGESLSLAPPALGRWPDPAADVAPLVAFLLSDAAHGLTGATLCADGGVWMAP